MSPDKGSSDLVIQFEVVGEAEPFKDLMGRIEEISIWQLSVFVRDKENLVLVHKRPRKAPTSGRLLSYIAKSVIDDFLDEQKKAEKQR